MVRFALVGCGRIAQRHAALLGEGRISNAQLVAVCDLKPERAQRLAQKYSVPAFTAMHEMMRQMGSQIDAVCILTESGNHAAHCVELAPYRKALIVEKPFALSVEDADRMTTACTHYSTPLFVVKQNRFNKAVQHLKQALDQGRFGKLVLGTVRVRWRRDQAYYDQDAWRGTRLLDGGVFFNQASHHVDLLQWLMGDPLTIYATTTRALAKIECEDTGVAVLKFRSGALGAIEATTATRPTDLEGSISILGEKGTVELAGFAVNQVRVWQFTEPKPGDADVAKLCNESPPNVYGMGHQAFLNHVVDCLLHQHKPLVDGIEARKSVEILCAISQSATSEKLVSFPVLRSRKWRKAG